MHYIYLSRKLDGGYALHDEHMICSSWATKLKLQAPIVKVALSTELFEGAMLVAKGDEDDDSDDSQSMEIDGEYVADSYRSMWDAVEELLDTEDFYVKFLTEIPMVKEGQIWRGIHLKVTIVELIDVQSHLGEIRVVVCQTPGKSKVYYELGHFTKYWSLDGPEA